MGDKQAEEILAKIKETEPFDIAQAVGLDPNSPGHERTKLQLTIQMLVFTLTRLITDNPKLQNKIEEYNQDFIEKVKHDK